MSALRALHPVASPGISSRAASAVASVGADGRAASAPVITVLLAEADPEIARPLAAQLLADGYDPVVARSTTHARALFEIRQPRLAILGELEAAHAALGLLEHVRGTTPLAEMNGALRADLPVIVLGSSVHELDLLRAFEAGADDFLARPPRYLELRVRIRALLRRAGAADDVHTHLQVAGLTIDHDARIARIRGHRLQLRRREYELLVALASAPDRVFPKQELLLRVWGYGSGCTTRTLDSHASRLRRKLTALELRHWIVNVRGVGYRLM